MCAGVCKTGHAHLNAAWQAALGELQLEFEPVLALCKSAISTEHFFILKERRKSISKILAGLFAPARPQVSAIGAKTLPGGSRCFVNLHEAVQTNDNMCDSSRLDHTKPHVSRDDVTGRVFFVLVVCLDGELCNVARGRGKRRCESGEDAASRR